MSLVTDASTYFYGNSRGPLSTKRGWRWGVGSIDGQKMDSTSNGMTKSGAKNSSAFLIIGLMLAMLRD